MPKPFLSCPWQFSEPTCQLSIHCMEKFTYSSYSHKDKRDRALLRWLGPLSFILESSNWSCFVTQGGSFGEIHRHSPVSLCLKSGLPGYRLLRLLSHHSCGLAKKICHKCRRLVSSILLSNAPKIASSMSYDKHSSFAKGDNSSSTTKNALEFYFEICK